jgi:hypothetical protein
MRYLTKSDLILIFLVLGMAGLLFVLRGYGKKDGKAILLATAEKIRFISLDEECFIEVDGPLGVTRIEIRSQMVKVVSSPCRGKDCIKMGWIKREGETILCIPNRVKVSILGETKLDSISR